MDNTARSNAAATHTQQTGSTPESLRARFNNIQRQANLTSLSYAVAQFKWDAELVCVNRAERRVDGHRYAMRDLLSFVSLALSVSNAGDNETDQRNYQNLWDELVALRESIDDWHLHTDDDSTPEFLDTRHELGAAQ